MSTNFLKSGILEAAREFFALPAEEKDAIHIRNSPHFRGYSEMNNERDWREQIHFSTDGAPGGEGFRRLQGPNLWPRALGERWRSTVLGYLEEMKLEGQRILADAGLPVDEPPYLLMKMICYYPGENRPGVAAHCDWSWLTIVRQDDVGGLEAQAAGGRWVAEREPVFVNYGELAEIATGGTLRAVPHRVVNRSRTRPRISIPVFLCPPLAAAVRSKAACFVEAGEHVHRVRNPRERWGDFHFGRSEWRRKGEGAWCWRGDCLKG
jgi:isopenicillin N synthase-like dioxygenase